MQCIFHVCFDTFLCLLFDKGFRSPGDEGGFRGRGGFRGTPRGRGGGRGGFRGGKRVTVEPHRHEGGSSMSQLSQMQKSSAHFGVEIAVPDIVTCYGSV